LVSEKSWPYRDSGDGKTTTVLGIAVVITDAVLPEMGVTPRLMNVIFQTDEGGLGDLVKRNWPVSLFGSVCDVSQ